MHCLYTNTRARVCIQITQIHKNMKGLNDENPFFLWPTINHINKFVVHKKNWSIYLVYGTTQSVLGHVLVFISI